MFKSSYQIARVWGIPIKVHVSLIILTLYLALSAGAAAGPVALALRLALAVGVFTSIALHELGHSYVALRLGCRVREITLMFMGGAAQMESMPVRPRGEALMSLAGPAVSIALGAAGYFGGPVLAHAGFEMAGAFIGLLGLINLILAGFNLLPAFPMDGGRVFRALLTPKFGRVRATWIASRLGKIVAVLFVLYALPALSDRWILAAIGVFIYTAAGREYTFVRWQEARRRGEYTDDTIWPFGRTSAPPPPPADEDVVIGPPPYARRGTSRSEIERHT